MALEWDDAADRISTGLVSHASARSYAIWTWRNSGVANNSRIFAKHDGSTNYLVNFSYSTANGGTYVFELRADGALGGWRIANPTADAWHHIVIVSDGITAPVIYVDGVSVTVTEQLTPSGNLLTNAESYILGNLLALDRGWLGYLAEWAVWDRKLTAADARAVYVASPLVTPQSLVSYCPLVTVTPVLGDIGATPDLVGSPAVTSGIGNAPHPRVARVPPPFIPRGQRERLAPPFLRRGSVVQPQGWQHSYQHHAIQ